YSPLIYASQYKYLEIVKLLLKNGANVNHRNVYGYSSLMCALKRGNFEIAKKLLEKGANPNFYTKIKLYSSLMFVVHRNSFEMLELLLKYNVDITHKDIKNKDAFIWALKFNLVEIAKYLLHKNCYTRKQDIPYKALLKASKYGQLEIVKLLLDRGANIDICHYAYGTPLIVA